MLTAKWFLRSIISFLVLQGVLGEDEEEFPECDSELYLDQYYDHHTSGMVTSPNFNGDGYPPGSRCQFTIHIPQGHRLNLHIGGLDLEPSDFCSLDSLQINDTLTVRTLCGTNIPTEPIFVKEGVKHVHLTFRSDKNQTRPEHMPNRRGFHIQFMTSSQLVDPCQHMKRCRNGRCYHESMTCKGQDYCGDGTDEEGCDLPQPTVKCGEPPAGIGPDYLLDQPDGITGEREVMHGSWPWQVSLLDRNTYFSYSCGGTLISPQWILTAARCFEEHPDPNYWQVNVGVHHKYQQNPDTKIRYVERIIVYPNKTADDLFELEDNFDSNDDIALLKLNAPIQLENHIFHPVCLPQPGRDVPPGTRCYAAGWGPGTPPDDVLKVIDLFAMSTSNCSYDSSTQICVENPGCQSACNGDIGNPLVAKFDSKWYVVGIGSNRAEGYNRSAATNETIIYTKVSDKAEWIRKMMDKYS